MKCILEINSRANLTQPAELKHEVFIDFLKKIDPKWGLSEDLDILFPGFGKEFTSSLDLSKHLVNGIKMNVFYRYRNQLADHHSSDDKIYIEFNSKKADYERLVKSLFSEFVDVFDAYRASVFNEKIIYEDFEISRDKNYRKTAVRIHPVVFYDEIFCKDVFGMDAQNILAKLSGEVGQVSIHNNGILIIADTKPLSVEESDDFDQKIKVLLNYKI